MKFCAQTEKQICMGSGTSSLKICTQGALPLTLQTFASPKLHPIPTIYPWVSKDGGLQKLSDMVVPSSKNPDPPKIKILMPLNQEKLLGT